MMFQEDFLHFIWKLGYFDKTALCTTEGVPIEILHPGQHNQNAGPDFDFARVQIGEVLWVGKVEIHLQSSDWHAHGHQRDAAYENVILHVVWEHNREVCYPDGRPIPTLTLQEKVGPLLVERHAHLYQQPHDIPCHAFFREIPSIKKQGMLSRVLLERLQRKAEAVHQLWESNSKNWEETTYQLLAKSFGFKINDEPFLALAKALPLKIIRKHANHRQQLEALLFGQAGMLAGEPVDDYHQSLQQEYRFLSHKYGLESRQLPQVMWRFSKLRPTGFPTLGIAYLAAILQHHPNLFALLLKTCKPEEIQQLFDVQRSAYWQNHYRFGKVSKTVVTHKFRQAHFLINTVAPLYFAYEQYKSGNDFQERALTLLECIPAENHRITRKWEALGLHGKAADETQAALELYQQYCQQRRCLHCHIGASILSQKPTDAPVKA